MSYSGTQEYIFATLFSLDSSTQNKRIFGQIKSELAYGECFYSNFWNTVDTRNKGSPNKGTPNKGTFPYLTQNRQNGK